MRNFLNPDATIPSRTTTSPAENPPPPSLSFGNEHLTALESEEAFKSVLGAFAQDLSPNNDLNALFVEELASSFWMQRRYSAIANHRLSLDLEQNHQQVLQQYPNADAFMHTVFAHDRLQQNPGYRHALTEYDKAFRRTMSLYGKVRRYRKER